MLQAFLMDGHLAIVSDYASLGDLADFIDAQRKRSRQTRGLPEEQARRFFQQLMLAVDFWCAYCSLTWVRFALKLPVQQCFGCWLFSSMDAV